jgi:hypothetical protein
MCDRHLTLTAIVCLSILVGKDITGLVHSRNVPDPQGFGASRILPLTSKIIKKNKEL